MEKTDLDEAVRKILDEVRKAERPVVFAGGGVRLSGAHADFIRLVENSVSRW